MYDCDDPQRLWAVHGSCDGRGRCVAFQAGEPSAKVPILKSIVLCFDGLVCFTLGLTSDMVCARWVENGLGEGLGG